MDENINRKRSKTVKSRSNTAVQGTNDCSIVSKSSMVKYGYFQDQFLSYFVAKESRRSPLIHRGYYIRSYAIDYFLKLFLKASNEISEKRQIISLGAGFDTAYFRLKSQGLLENCVFYEVDFLDVVKRKASSIRQTKELNELLIEDFDDKIHSPELSLVEIYSKDYVLIGVDLTQIKQLDDVLRQCHINHTCCTLILSECVLTYLPPSYSQAVIKWAVECFSNAVFIDYEQINPDTAFGHFMQNHFKKTGSTLKCINTFPSLQSQAERFFRLGWEVYKCWDMNDIFFNLVPMIEKEDIERKELFDEFEGWHLVCSHYTIIWASIGSPNSYCLEVQKKIDTVYRSTTIATKQTQINERTIQLLNSSETIMRFGHSCAVIPSGLLVIYGGFGMENSHHQRLSNISIVELKSWEMVKISTSKFEKQTEVARMYHTSIVLSHNTIFLFGGRTSPRKACQDAILIKLEGLTHNSSDLGSTTATHDEDEQILDPLKFDLRSSSYNVTFKKVKMYGEQPCARWRHTATVFQKNGHPQMIVYGGRTEQHNSLDDCYILDLNSWHWSKVDPCGSKLMGLHSHTSCLWKNRWLVLAGGLTEQLIPSKDIYLLDLYTFQWKALDVSGVLYPRYSHTAHVIDDNLFLIGGVNLEHFSPGIAVINLQSGESQEFALTVQSETGEIIMLHGHQSEILNDEHLLIVGGGCNCFSFGTHLNKSMFLIDLKYFQINCNS
ncbi:tRNA wybutosine-synthesizing protein 4 isoform X1 [Octopus bimaculoides]|uniref:tRNA wybutosine-synthesizing protein 4 n=2 Tax=Octopus bimaculoides TaxID=37653 RepID=A0A0L8HGF9_OCTBM|nr:tRNA wybutosine-synthesizing protein 4 isoform X1 [Octopus bimaculoides]|eukprot:XP_014772780.1 PREDICTED: tRNA wybutosine-synthesizing protein 4-like isoform X1 [Octopus bimaculoides]